jgi:thiol-disulfide isomerase/thioredoxin
LLNLYLEASHLFDEVQIVTSKNFANKHQLYDKTQMSEELPQFYLIETNNLTNKNIFSFSYFRFPDEFNKYLKGKGKTYNNPVKVDNLSYAIDLNAANFEEKVLNDNSFKEFLVEVKHEGCPTCFMLGKMIDHLSQKFQKHKLSKKFKFFRIDSHNDLPFIGDFSATPTYLYCKKENNKITSISQLDKNDFLFQLKKNSSLDLTKIRYHPNIGYGFHIYQNLEFLQADWNPDNDVLGFNK